MAYSSHCQSVGGTSKQMDTENTLQCHLFVEHFIKGNSYKEDAGMEFINFDLEFARII